LQSSIKLPPTSLLLDLRQGWAKAGGMRSPDFFIIGAPKCGTTALSQYLSEHPQICFSAVKEPHFYADDFPAYKIDKSKAAFWRRNFSRFDPAKHKLAGEGSVFYYLSDVAVPNILADNPSAKFIFMVRDPVELAYSFYFQQRYSGVEDADTFEEAWDLQAARRAGRNIPARCREPKFLQYRTVAALEARLQYLTMTIPPGNLQVLSFDDFIRDTRACYLSVLDFLGLPSDGRTSFPVVNSSHMQRSKILGLVATSIPNWLHASVREAKRFVGLSQVPLNVVAMLNSKPAVRPPLAADVRRRISEEMSIAPKSIHRA
jgi:hypothetical protein